METQENKGGVLKRKIVRYKTKKNNFYAFGLTTNKNKKKKKQ
jgi:hypothetical protein